MTDENLRPGLYTPLQCPHCGHVIKLIVEVSVFSGSKKKAQGIVHNSLPQMALDAYMKFSTLDKLIFCIGKFFEVYGAYPSGRELSQFSGFTQQTIWRYAKRYENFINSRPQIRSPEGRFGEKLYFLTSEGNERYNQIVYKLFSMRKF